MRNTLVLILSTFKKKKICVRGLSCLLSQLKQRWLPALIFRSQLPTMSVLAAFEKKNITEHCQALIKILKHAEGLNEKLTPLKLIDAWMGKGAAKFRVAGVAVPALPREDLEKIIVHALLQQYLKYTAHLSLCLCFFHCNGSRVNSFTVI